MKFKLTVGFFFSREWVAEKDRGNMKPLDLLVGKTTCKTYANHLVTVPAITKLVAMSQFFVVLNKFD